MLALLFPPVIEMLVGALLTSICCLVANLV